jgi:hypothetical protein
VWRVLRFACQLAERRRRIPTLILEASLRGHVRLSEVVTSLIYKSMPLPCGCLSLAEVEVR